MTFENGMKIRHPILPDGHIMGGVPYPGDVYETNKQMKTNKQTYKNRSKISIVDL